MLLLLIAAAVRALPVPPQEIPVARLVSNLTERVAKNPADIQAVFTLGRVHYFAFAGASDTVNVLSRPDTTYPVPYDFFAERGKGESAYGKPSAPLREADRLAHLKNAITYLSRAVALDDPREPDGRYALCLACAYEDGALFATKAGVIETTAADERAWIEAAIRYYGLAFDRAVANDSQSTRRPTFGLETLVSYEAGRSYQRLLERRGNADADEQSRLTRITQFLATMEKLAFGAITPLVFALNRPAELVDLLAPQRIVWFDLNGSHLPQRYRWVRPDTGILVWDPAHTSRITSGRQLFGSVTWWMFWDDAYQALEVLDEDRSGWIEGRELADLAVWFDRDQDGRSDHGEVVRIESTPIAAIAAHASGTAGGAAMNAKGLRLNDGHLLPTYDWVTTPVAPLLTDRRRTAETLRIQ